MGQSDLVVLDTHKWIFWVHGDRRLPEREDNRLNQIAGVQIVVPAICLVEVGQLHFRGRIDLKMPLKDWFDYALGYPGVELCPISPRIVAEAYSLPEPFHRDPADRLIVATARVLDADLLTDDRLIRDYPHVRTP